MQTEKIDHKITSSYILGNKITAVANILSFVHFYSKLALILGKTNAFNNIMRRDIFHILCFLWGTRLSLETLITKKWVPGCSDS